MSTSAELGSVPAREDGRVSMLIRGSSATTGDGGESGGVGLDRRSARGREEGASSMRSERGVVDMLIERMIVGDGMVRMCYVTAGTFARRGLSSTAKTLRSLSGVRGSEY